MFEKEAEEYIKEHTFFDEEYGVQSLDVVSKTIFKDGAEFGYNKANEWHYVKDGDLPDTECSVLIYCIGGYRIEKYYKNRKLFGEFSLDFVYGWQYLPDYIETAKGD